jgi:hypothetical protein
MLVYTKTGSIYHIDAENKIWARLFASPQSGHVRTGGGEFHEIWPIEIGEPLRITGPALTEGASLRYIQTSPVVKIDYE